MTELDVYDRALAGEDCWVRNRSGARHRIRVRRWLGGAGDSAADHRADHVLTCCCDGPTVDLGCGPGRLAALLTRRGVAALGVDISPMAVAMTRRRGVPALRRDLFGPLPGTGRWAYALLADGNLGIGGDPLRILRRARDLLAPDGVAIVEFARPGTGLIIERIRLEAPSGVGEWFPWARVGIERAETLTAAAGLRVLTTATVSGRPIAWLARS
ncbi:methyltransferase domain-containing protein [Nocardia jejuensis]|uniref:methyltransferase domain-containing protein n=1 Tax=Nocardia jejuensis TaxID=328049 RepID=UPI00082E4A9F|nr:methyltransferase domain-containing protein [Nocardia jejuensis]